MNRPFTKLGAAHHRAWPLNAHGLRTRRVSSAADLQGRAAHGLLCAGNPSKAHTALEARNSSRNSLFALPQALVLLPQPS